MKKQTTQTFYLFIAAQILIFLLSYLVYKEFSLLLYINISFYIGALFIFISSLFFTIKSGFFDAVTKSFRQVFAGKDITKKEIEEMPLPSQGISINTLPLLLSGLLTTIIMLFALWIYSF